MTPHDQETPEETAHRLLREAYGTDIFPPRHVQRITKEQRALMAGELVSFVRDTAVLVGLGRDSARIYQTMNERAGMLLALLEETFFGPDRTQPPLLAVRETKARRWLVDEHLEGRLIFGHHQGKLLVTRSEKETPKEFDTHTEAALEFGWKG